MPLTIISGCSLRDEMFELDERIFGENITWNVTRLKHAALIGVFGKPLKSNICSIADMSDADKANIDWAKVERFAKLPEVFHEPAITVLTTLGNGDTHAIPVDGHHRLCARMNLGLAWYDTFVVPADMEREFRINVMEMK